MDSDLITVVVTVIEAPDESLVTGTGFAGGTMSDAEFEDSERGRIAAAEELLESTSADLGIEGARAVVLFGEPGSAICYFAESEGADVILMGSRGRGGFKRAVLGSVSDHVVRHGPCPVVVTGQHHSD